MSHATLPPIKGTKRTKPNNIHEENITKPNNFESLQFPPKTLSKGEYRDPKSLPCEGFETNFVEAGPKKIECQNEISNLTMQTLSFKNLENITYQRNSPGIYS